MVASLGQMATIVATWPLWRHRAGPPNLPVFEVLASVPWAVPLLVAAVVAMIRPRVGALAFCGLFALSVLGDQIRLQPEVVSLALLMVAPAFGAQGRTVARWHLATLWLWAGIHKALSLGWPSLGASFVADSLRAPGLRPVVAVLLPAVEIGLGLCAMSRRTWRLAAWGGLVFHLGTLVTLAVLARWGEAVWPWNLALALCAFLLFARPEPAPAAAPVRPATRAIAAALVVYPGLFYVGWGDVYLAHNLYTANLPRAVACNADGLSCGPAPGSDLIYRISVPLPPEARLFRRLFDQSCAPGTTLKLIGRATRLSDPPSVSLHPCPATEAVPPKA